VVICGTLKYESGAVRVFGEDLTGMKSSKLTAFRGKNIGFVFQQFNLIATWTSLENVSVPLLLNGVGRKQAEAAGKRLLEEVGIGDKSNVYPSQLSGGQQQRVAIARALVHVRRLLVCDEPTAALDAASGRKVLELLKQIACRPDRCVIVVTHDSRIFPFADRVAEMEDGLLKGSTVQVNTKWLMFKRVSFYFGDGGYCVCGAVWCAVKRRLNRPQRLWLSQLRRPIRTRSGHEGLSKG